MISLEESDMPITADICDFGSEALIGILRELGHLVGSM